jgi:hypothetical protein
VKLLIKILLNLIINLCTICYATIIYLENEKKDVEKKKTAIFLAMSLKAIYIKFLNVKI